MNLSRISGGHRTWRVTTLSGVEYVQEGTLEVWTEEGILTIASGPLRSESEVDLHLLLNFGAVEAAVPVEDEEDDDDA